MPVLQVVLQVANSKPKCLAENESLLCVLLKDSPCFRAAQSVLKLSDRRCLRAQQLNAALFTAEAFCGKK